MTGVQASALEPETGSPPETTTIPDIQDSVSPDASAGRDFLERYYECRYMLDVKEPGHDYRLLFHSNGIIVVTLAPSHPLINAEADVTHIDFQVTQHTNRLDNTVTGKGKRGAQVLTPNAPLFRAELSDGTKLAVPACARGKLVQLNERLLSDPQLLKDGATFLALILPKLGTSSGQKKDTVDTEEYLRRRPGVDLSGGLKRKAEDVSAGEQDVTANAEVNVFKGLDDSGLDTDKSINASLRDQTAVDNVDSPCEVAVSADKR